MKNIAITFLILIINCFSGYSKEVCVQQSPQTNSQDNAATKKYSQENLQQASLNDLNLYLKKAKGRKTTGKVMTFTGPVLMLTGLVMAIGWKDGSVPVTLTGLAATSVGVPLWISGSKRSKKVNHELQKRTGVSYNVSPGLFYANFDKNPFPGITLRIGL